MVAGKQIRRDEEGLEIFDDYLSPSSGMIPIRILHECQGWIDKSVLSWEPRDSKL